MPVCLLLLAGSSRSEKLLAQNDNLQIHEEKNKGVYVKGLSDYYVSNAKEVYEIMRQGGNARVVTATSKPHDVAMTRSSEDFLDMNAESSRSHSIFLITINQRNTDTGAQKTGNLYLVDLAGSEKVGKTGASGQTLEEAKKINKSLSALGMVINALTDGKVRSILRTLHLDIETVLPSLPIFHIEIPNSLVSCKSRWAAIHGQH